MKTSSLTVLFGCLTFGTAGVVPLLPAQTINIDFQPGTNLGPNPNGGANSIPYSGVAAAPDTGTYWNVVAPVTNGAYNQYGVGSGGFVTGTLSDTTLVYSSGQSSSLSLQGTSTGGNLASFASNSTSAPAQNALGLMSDYIIAQNNSTQSITISGLQAHASFTLYLYGAGDKNVRQTLFTVDGGAQATTGISGNVHDLTLGEDYVVYTGILSTSTLTIDYTSANPAFGNPEGDFNGLQLTVIEQKSIATIPGVQYSLNQSNIAEYIDATFQAGRGGPGFQNLITSLDSLANSNNPQAVTAVLDQLSPESFENFARSIVFNNASFSGDLLDRYIESRRSSDGEFLVDGGNIDSTNLAVLNSSMDGSLAATEGQLLAWNPPPMSHGLLSDSTNNLTGIDLAEGNQLQEQQACGLNMFVAGNVILAQDFSQNDLPHADMTTSSLQLGGDYRILPHLIAGLLMEFSHTDAELDDNGSEATIDSYSPAVFLSYANGNWYGHTLGSYAYDSFTEQRHIDLGGSSTITNGAPTGSHFSIDLDGGYDFHYRSWNFGPTTGIQYTHLDLKSFDESGGQPLGAALNVGEQQADSLFTRWGGHLDFTHQTGGLILTPHVSASWEHEFLDESRSINSGFSGDGAGTFAVSTPKVSRDSALIDCGLRAGFNAQGTLFIDYIAQAGQSNYFGQLVQAGVKICF